jgi:Na+-transporting NADH:ubiquinone oxidoreductase subunit C
MKRKAWTVVFLVIVVCISTGVLNSVYIYTEPAVQRNANIKIKIAVLKALNISYKQSEIDTAFREHVDIQNLEDMKLYRSNSEVAFEISGSGLWGKISAMIALEADLETIRGLVIFDNSETPGLGGRISEDRFQEQFKGKKLAPELKIVPRGKSLSSNQVDAISGATQTSKALEKIINSNIEAFYEKIGKRNAG